MIKIVAKMVVAESKIAEFKETAAELVRKSRAEEGNLFYSLNVSAENPRVLAFMECWKDQAAIDAHNATEHFAGILPRLVAMCEEAPVIELFGEIEY